jgi:starvation-inducible DNA-binding protein
MDIDIGIDEQARTDIAGELSKLLADTYTLYVTTQGYHWNVTGPMFRSLHLMFEEEYLELRDAVDVVAERIRALGHPAPGSFAQFRALSSVSGDETVPEAIEMVRRLAKGNEATARTARRVVETAEKGGDVATADLATARIELHEKTAWMLRSTAS